MVPQNELIEVLKMQSILNGSICLLIALVCACGAFAAYTVIRNGLKLKEPTDADTRRWLVSLGAALGVASLAGFFVFFWLGLTKVVNPGMSAIDYIVRTAQGKLF